MHLNKSLLYSFRMEFWNWLLTETEEPMPKVSFQSFNSLNCWINTRENNFVSFKSDFIRFLTLLTTSKESNRNIWFPKIMISHPISKNNLQFFIKINGSPSTRTNNMPHKKSPKHPDWRIHLKKASSKRKTILNSIFSRVSSTWMERNYILICGSLKDFVDI